MGVRLGRKGRGGKRGEGRGEKRGEGRGGNRGEGRVEKRGEGRGERRAEEEGRMIRNGGGKSGKAITCGASRDDLWAV